MALSLQVGGQIAVVHNALVRSVGQVDLGEGAGADLGGEQVALLPALVHLLQEDSLVQLSLAAALHGRQGTAGEARAGQLTTCHGGEGARLRPALTLVGWG